MVKLFNFRLGDLGARDHAAGANHRIIPSNFDIIAKLQSKSDNFISEKMLIDILMTELNRIT